MRYPVIIKAVPKAQVKTLEPKSYEDIYYLQNGPLHGMYNIAHKYIEDSDLTSHKEVMASYNEAVYSERGLCNYAHVYTIADPDLNEDLSIKENNRRILYYRRSYLRGLQFYDNLKEKVKQVVKEDLLTIENRLI